MKDDFSETLTAASAAVSSDEAERLVRELYGIDGRARRQPGERDDNFAVEGPAGQCFLKVVHAAEPPEVTDLVTSMLCHLDAAGDVPVQSVIPTRDGRRGTRVTIAGSERAVRLTTYIAGRMLHTVAPRPALERELGAVLARVGRALRHFKHPAAEREVLWDLWRADRVRPMLDELTDDAQHDELAACLDRFEAQVRPHLGGGLRRQLVHNDLSGDNVVVGANGHVVGLIDFGDATVTQLVNDVAIGMTNRLVDGPDPLAAAVDILCGYHAAMPLRDAEVALLYDLIRTRTAMRLVISEWRARRFPDNSRYILRNTPRAREHFDRLPAAAATQATDRFAEALASAT